MREYEVNGELLDESCDLFEKKKRHGIKTTYTTGDIGYSIRQFNKQLTGYGNDNNNPSTEEAKARAAAEKAAEAVGTFASQSPDGGSSISTAPAGGATGGDSAGASAGGGLGEAVELDEAGNLTPYEKMKLFDQGQRKENVKACGDDKLRTYRRICQSYNFNNALKQIEDEMRARRILPQQQTSGSTSYTMSQQTAQEVIDEIFDKMNISYNGDIYAYLYNTDFRDKFGRHAVGALNGDKMQTIETTLNLAERIKLLFCILLMALTDNDDMKILQLRSYFKNNLGIPGTKVKEKLTAALQSPAIVEALNDYIKYCDQQVNATESLTEADLREAKRYVRRYYIRPWDIFCSNKAEILKALVDNQNENCSIYTLNNLGDEKDVTKLTNKDIIYYYDDGILYDKNHVKVMDYDLYIKHEENRDSIKPSQVSDTTFANVYDDRITTATELEEDAFSKNPVCSLDELRDKLLDGLYIVIGMDQKDADTEVNFSDNSRYSHTNYEASYEDGVGFTVQGWLVSDDGAEEEGERTDFDTFEELVDWINGKTFDECYVTLSQSRAVKENNPLTLDFPDIDAKGDVLHEGKEDTQVCCICGEEFKGYGNNPEPYMSAENGERCCDACNAHFVIQARLNQMAAERNNAKED